MDWESIKYVFQIPVSWYSKIHNMVFNAYGTNFIQVKEGYYGGMEISLDEEAFNRQLSDQLSGAVKSVDGVEPDGNGNIELCAVTLTGDQTIYGTKTFASNVYLSSQPGLPDANSLALATVGHVNTFYARKSHDHGNLNNDGTITNIGSGIAKDYYIAADSNGDLYKSDLSAVLDGVVKSVNDTLPDENGNVTIDVGGSVAAVNGIGPDQNGNVILGDIVHTVENTAPDQNGNVELTAMVKSVNNVYPVNGNVTLEISSITMEDVEDYIEEQNFATEEYVTNQLTNYVDNTTLETTLEDYATLTDIEDMVTAVDGHQPDVNGAVSFGLASNKWMKTDGDGHIATTNDVPIVLSSGNNGFLYANNGSLEFKTDEYVTLSTEQTITAKKTFDVGAAQVIIGDGLSVQTSPQGQTVLGNGAIKLFRGGGVPYIAFDTAGGSGANEHRGTIRRDPAGDYMVIEDTQGIYLHAPANYTQLVNQPTDTSGSSLAVATVGYCQTNFGKVKSVNGNTPDSNGNVTITVGTGTVKSVDHHSPDSDGNVQLNAICTINGHNGDSVGNFAGVVTSVNGETPNDGAVTISVVETVNSTSPDANGNVDVGTVTEVDGHSPDAQGAVSFGLTASKWVKTDSSGHLTTTNDTPVSIPSNKTGQTKNITLVTGVTWNGTQLVVARTQLNFTKGVLTGTTAQSNTTIATVAYT